MRKLTTRTQLQGKSAQKACPRISRPPEKLAWVLEAVNQIPSGLDFDHLPPIGEIEAARTTISKAVGWHENPWLEKSFTIEGREVIASTLDPTISKTAEWILVGGNAFDRYQLALWSKNLRQIAQGFHRGRIEVLYHVTNEGEFRVDRDPLIEGLNACGKKQLLHLRLCALCGQLFWAKKLTREQLHDPHSEVGCDDCKNKLRLRRTRSKPGYQRPPRSPAHVQEVKQGINQWCEDHHRKQFKRSTESIQWVAEYIARRAKTVERCLVYLEYRKNRAKTVPKH